MLLTFYIHHLNSNPHSHYYKIVEHIIEYIHLIQLLIFLTKHLQTITEIRIDDCFVT